MKRANRRIIALVATSLFSATFFACEDGTTSTTGSGGCGTYNGHNLYEGPQGGCYYYNSNGNKTYVDRDLCNC